jgi:UDP-N-acetyl-D-glucosamine/UDP-N-acetyl-D-galactosamine dehydrogenase
MSDVRIAVIGLGYVGLPLAVALSAKFPVVGFDVNADRIAELREGRDRTGEIDTEALSGSSLRLTDDIADSAGCNLFIVTVPTPVDDANRPDFGPVLSACQLVGSILAPGSIVVFESTVYPGATEDICGPALEHASGLRVAADFQLGYSPVIGSMGLPIS